MNERIFEELAFSAEAARTSAYSPYSGVTVGATLLTENGNMYLGANIENASYGATVCAERVAIFKAINAGERKICAIAIAGAKAGEPVSKPFTPCGICRQVMAEFGSRDMKVIIVTSEGYDVFTLDELLPFSFSGENLSHEDPEES
jgi:cytidine deaminase